MSYASNSISNPSRLASLVNTGLLDSPVEVAFERLTSLAARTIRAPVSLVSLVDRERQFFKSAFGLPEPWLSKRESPLSHSFCRHVVETQKPLLIENARTHPLVEKNLAIRDLHVIAYAGMPLQLANGQCIGSFCVIDHRPRAWTCDEIQLLSDIAASVMAEIDLRVMIAAKEELFDLVIHDLKNLLSTTLVNTYLALRKTERVENSKSFRNLELVKNSSESMKGIVQNIGDLNHIERGEMPFRFEDHDLVEIIDAALLKVSAFAIQENVELKAVDLSPIRIRCDAERLSQALSDLLLVSIRRSTLQKQVEIRVSREPHQLLIEISDQGPSLTPEDVAHFFDRFVKSPSLPNRGTKLALCLAKEIISAHEGEIDVEAKDGSANRICVTLPLEQS